MKPKKNPKFVALTYWGIAIGEFKTSNQLKTWLKNYDNKNAPIKRILSGKKVKEANYLPFF